MHKKISPIRQLTQTECGICCIAMISQYYGLVKPIRFFRDKLDVGRDGASVSSLITTLELVNIKSSISRVNDLSLEDNFEPIIVHLSDNHFAVLEKYNKRTKTFNLLDPAVGRVKIKKDELYKIADVAILAQPGPKFKKEVEKESVWKPLFFILRLIKPRFLITLALSIITYLFTLFIPFLIQTFIDRLTIGKENLFTINDLSVAISSVLLFLFVSFFRNKVIVSLEVLIDKNLTFNVIKHILKLPYKFFEIRSQGEILFRINLLNSIRILLSEGLIRGIIDFGSLFFVTVYMSLIAPNLIVVVFLIIVLLFFISNIINNIIVKINKNELVELSSVSNLEAEIINSIFDIKCLGIEEFFLTRLKFQYEKFITIFQKREIVLKNNISILQFFQLFVPFLLLIINILLMNNTKLSLGKVIAYYTLSSMVINNSISLFQEFSNFKLMKNSLLRVNDILNEKVEEESGNINIDTFKSLKIDNMDFSYSNNSKPVLKKIDIDVQNGKKIAIVGVSGSGKSTLAKLILGLYRPSNGRILYNGIDMDQIDRASLQKLIGIIPQDAKLFNGTIHYNITLNSSEISDNEVIEAMKKANIYDEVQMMPLKEKTIISEFGRNLSGGQRQRIILARALVHKPQLLILDEATSSLDGLNEQEVANILKSHECTQIVISHRLSTISSADYIYLVKEGEIIEEGTIDYLIEKKGSFYTLFFNQIDSFYFRKEIV